MTVASPVVKWLYQECYSQFINGLVTSNTNETVHERDFKKRRAYENMSLTGLSAKYDDYASQQIPFASHNAPWGQQLDVHVWCGRVNMGIHRIIEKKQHTDARCTKHRRIVVTKTSSDLFDGETR